MSRATITDTEVLDLAKYAHDTLAPIYARARKVEPTTSFHIAITFSHADAWSHKFSHIDVSAHWGREGMLNQEICLTTEAEVDALAVTLTRRIAGLRAKR